MNENISKLIFHELNSFQPTSSMISKAIRHLSEKKRKELYSKIWHTQHSALGKLFECVIYEKLLEMSIDKKCFTVIGKGSDITKKNKMNPKLGQNGFYYDLNGDILFRGNGQDLAEFDAILTTSDEIVFVEVKNSKRISQDFGQLIMYKKRLLKHLFDKPIGFVLISSFDLENEPCIKTIVSGTSDCFVKTFSREFLNEEIKSINQPFKAESQKRNSIKLLSDLKSTKIDYKKLHDSCRKKIVKTILSCNDVNIETDFLLVKRLIIGRLPKDSVIKLLSQKKIITKNKILDYETYTQLFSKIILSLSIPELRLTFYVKGLQKNIYLKMGPHSSSTIMFERNISRNTAFFEWLDSTHHEIDPKLMEEIFAKYLDKKNCCNRKKIGAKPKICW